MEMEFMAEFTEGMSRDRARQIIKGKRTKRQRPCSPFGISTTSSNSNSNNNNHCLIENLTPDQSPTISSNASTKEDEDMANCLMLLAQSVSPIKEEENSYQIRHKTEKLSARRLTDTTTVTAAAVKSDFYVYECKTCNRTFPSFQALGGHRASHKKPKVNVHEKISESIEYVEEDHDQYKYKEVEEDDENKASIININNNNQKSPSLSSSSSAQTGTVIVNNNNIKAKVHECSICGSEFLSGQALGGHMRKHRPIPVAGNRTVNTVEIITDQVINEKCPGSTGMLSLDLNFPPPEESKFQFTAGSSTQQQQQHLVFSTPAFVDCHY